MCRRTAAENRLWIWWLFHTGCVRYGVSAHVKRAVLDAFQIKIDLVLPNQSAST